MKTTFSGFLSTTSFRFFATLFCSLLAASLYSQSNISQSVSINSSGADALPSALLDVNATDKGFLLPRMTTAQRTAISSPANGLLVYDTEKKSLFFYDNDTWNRISPQSKIADADNNTRVETEHVANEDIVRIFLGGNAPYFFLRKNQHDIPRIDIVNSKLNTYMGEFAGASNRFGERNVGIGYYTMDDNIDGSRNTSIGWRALERNTHGNANVAVGYHAMFNNQTQSNMVAVGDSALYSNSLGNANVALGSKALFKNSSGNNNTAAGSQALFNSINGSNNTAFGNEALFDNTTGFNNSAVGRLALTNNTTGTGNTAIGFNSIATNTTGINNSAIGSSAYFTTSNLNNTTCIGFLSGGISNVSNRIEIGNPSVSWIGGQVNWGTYSDARIKTAVQENVPGLDFITRLRPVTYHLDIHKQNDLCFRGKKEFEEWEGMYDIEQKQMSGFIAQEVEAAAQAAGYDFSGVEKAADEVGLYSVRYAEFVVPLVKAVQEQQKIIENDSFKIALLEEMNADKEAEINNLKKQLEEANRTNSARFEKIEAALLSAGIRVEE